MKKRNLIDELTEGFNVLAQQRSGKRTLRTHVVVLKPAPTISARELSKLRAKLNLSRGLFAGYLRTNFNRRLVRFRAISGSQERHIGSHIVEFYNVRDGSA